MKKPVCLLLLLLNVAISSFAQREQDSLALVALYNSTGGANWTNNTNWMSSQPISTWYGVTVENNRVTKLQLEGNNLTGPFPQEICNLTNLTYLFLSRNELAGNLPQGIGNLNKLQDLILAYNQITNIPSELCNLTSLQTLNLFENQITGIIPTEIGNLTNLQYLSLDINKISGIIPSGIGSLRKLTYLCLSDNQITGIIPVEIGNLINLEALNLDGNQLSGIIPAEIGNLVNLYTLELSSNQLSGIIPSEIGNLGKLEYLWLNNNNLTGSIPLEIGNFSLLKELRLGGNQLGGSIPNSINNLIKINSIALESNRFDALPVLTLDSLDNLYIFNNRFTFEDIEPNMNVAKTGFSYSPQDFFGNEQDVSQRINKSYTFKISCGGSHNQYQWYKDNIVIQSATSSTFTIPKLQQSDAGSYTCFVTNTVVTGLTINSSPINLNVTMNGRAKDSLALVTLYNTLDGGNWTNNSNWLSSEPISTWYGVTIGNNIGAKGELDDNTSVVSLDLSENNLSGIIPSAIGDMIALQTLKLDNNDLSGSVPTDINNITSLQTLDLSNNKLNEFPPLTLGLLENLVIDKNEFSFADIVPNLNVSAKEFTYYSQDSIGIKKVVNFNPGSSIRFSASDSSANNTYQWYKDGVSILSTTDNAFLKTNLNVGDVGSYTCTINNSSVPGLTLFQRPVELLVSSVTGVDDLNIMGIRIYPNPTLGIIYIEADKIFPVQSKVLVTDIYGKAVFLKDLEGTKRQELDLTHLSKGVYYIRIQNKSNCTFHKVVIQ